VLGFDLEEETIKQEIAKRGAKRVLLQMPEGLKPQAPQLAKLIEKSGARPTHATAPAT
jgi:diphthamide biosynthesis enzyme Dph1/Dph2-like protein